MADIFTPAKRSEVMSRIRSTGNAATELRLRALLRAEKITGWRRHLPLALPPTPQPLRSSPGSHATPVKPPGKTGTEAKTKSEAKVPAKTKSNAQKATRAHAHAQRKAKAKAQAAAPSTSPHPRKRPRVRPDFVFQKERVVIFVDGCFWHGCPRHGTRPRQNRKFWDEKIARNRTRDRHVTRQLRKTGWTVLRLWECALTPKRLPHTLGRVKRALAK